MEHITVEKRLTHTDVQYKILTMGKVFDLPQGNPVTVVLNGYSYEGKMHNTTKGRIDGLADLYRDFPLQEGDFIRASYDPYVEAVELELIGGTQSTPQTRSWQQENRGRQENRGQQESRMRQESWMQQEIQRDDPWQIEDDDEWQTEDDDDIIEARSWRQERQHSDRGPAHNIFAGLAAILQAILRPIGHTFQYAFHRISARDKQADEEEYYNDKNDMPGSFSLSGVLSIPFLVNGIAGHSSSFISLGALLVFPSVLWFVLSFINPEKQIALGRKVRVLDRRIGRFGRRVFGFFFLLFGLLLLALSVREIMQYGLSAFSLDRGGIITYGFSAASIIFGIILFIRS